MLKIKLLTIAPYFHPLHALHALQGLLMMSTGLAGLSVVLTQPFHTAFYMFNRIGGLGGIGHHQPTHSPPYLHAHPHTHLHTHLHNHLHASLPYPHSPTIHPPGSGIGDTSTATLVAKTSRSKDARARNLGLIQSTRAAARIFTPVVSGKVGSKIYVLHICSTLIEPLPFIHM